MFSAISPHWVHTALVYYGPEDGITMYLNGSEIKSDFIGNLNGNFSDTAGSFIIGREYVIKNQYYADVIVAELYFWNQPLGAAVIQQLYNSQTEQ